MAGCFPDIEALAPDDLKGLVLQLLEDVVALKAENAALREEIARLKGLKGPPKLKPSGMEKATEPARAERKAGRRGGKIDRLVIDEERVLKAAGPPGSRFKGYETYVVQELILRPHVIRYRRERWTRISHRRIVWSLIIYCKQTVIEIFGKQQKYRVFFRSGPFFVRRREGLHGFGEPLQGAPCRRPVFPVLQHIDDRLVG